MTRFGPPINREMKLLDRSFFTKEVDLVVLVFPDPSKLGKFVKDCKQDVLYIPSVKHIVDVGSNKGVLLHEKNQDLSTFQDNLSENTKKYIKEFGLIPQIYKFKLDYNFWRADDILRAVLPEKLLDEIPTGFAQAGHVAHINLRDEFKPFGKLIGQVILDKNSKVETVVDKIDSIGSKFRTFQMNVLAGKDDLLVEQSESGCKFRFDFSKVYWNSRLNTEHERLISLFGSNGGVVGDVFAGVGPFAVPAGKKKIFVLANDLNPESYKYLNENIKLNKTDDFVRSSNLDGREFIKQSAKLLIKWADETGTIKEKKLVKKRKHLENQPAVFDTISYTIPKYFSDYVMNLPDSALTFLDEFIGLYSDPEVETVVKSIPGFKLPTIHVHCFEKFSSNEPEPSMEELHSRVHAKIIKYIDYNLPIEEFKFHLVRKVAPTKPMFCVSFTLPEEVAFKKA